MFSCPICPQHYSELISLSVHYRKQHKKTSQDLYVSLFCNNVIPLCKCGCGTQVKFLDITQGFREYKLGHASRVANNFQTEKSRSNSKSARRKMLEDGSWKPFVTKETGEHWSKGLTKETDERIRKMADTVSLPEESARRSERMRRNRLNGVVRTLHKEEHSQWKGGVTSLLSYCHSNKKLFTEWKYPKLLKSNFSCEKCGASRDANPRPLLEVHHDQQRMSEIVRYIAQTFGWKDHYATTPTDSESIEMKEKISDAVAVYHIENNISGIVLCQECHKAIHNKHNL